MRRDEQRRLIKELLTRLDSGTTVDAGGVRRNPTSVYVEPALAEQEWQAFFRSHPQLVGLSGDLPEPGSFVTTSDFGLPVLAVRDSDGGFRAFVNACRHRGALVVTEERGRSRRFSCPFHAWTYDTEGSLVGLPKRDHFGDVDVEGLGLVELPAVESHGLLWVHPQPDGAIDVDALLTAELAEELASWDLGSLRYLDRDSYDVACNWKLAMDTFGETYHFPVLHRNTIDLGFHGNVQCYDIFGRNHRMILCRRSIDQMRLRDEEEWNITTAGLPAYWLFPNVQLLPFAEGCYLVRAYPVPGDPGRHVSRITFYLRPGVDEVPGQEALAGEGVELHRAVAQAFARVIRDEDYVMSASQQEAARSGALSHTIFGRNEPALHHYHSTYRAALGLEPLPLLDPADLPAG
jgi:phenylpropionate dioxygenase-like ring-hydroxylating dioxygenase large terminal subunit